MVSEIVDQHRIDQQKNAREQEAYTGKGIVRHNFLT